MTYLIGQRLGRYQVQEEIGRGGMARVYRGLDTQLQRTVALKVLAPQLAIDPEFTRRFDREAVTVANLRHPNIVTIYDVGEQDGLRYIAMEFIRGRSLYTIIDERGALGLSYAIAIVEPIAAALDYAHSQGAVHRDVKPQNILLDVDGRVLLTDFGIAQGPEQGQERLTRTGLFMGTPEYISPEQASAERVDGRSDLYSLGIATYEIITGQVPFSGATPQLIVAHVQSPPPAPSTVDPAQPPELDGVLARILAKRPDSRFATGAAFTTALRSVARKRNVSVATADELADLTVPRPDMKRPTAPPLAPVDIGRVGHAPLYGEAANRDTTMDERTAVGPSPLIDVVARPAEPRRPAGLRPRPAASAQDDDRRVPWIWLGGLAIVLLLALLAAFYRDGGGASIISPTVTVIASPAPLNGSGMATPATATPTELPTGVPTVRATAPPTTAIGAPTSRPTNPPETTNTPTRARPPTRVSPTRTPVPPANTPEPPTDTPEPPTDTPVPPTDTPVPPTDTPVPPTRTPRPTEADIPTPNDQPQPTAIPPYPPQANDTDQPSAVAMTALPVDSPVAASTPTLAATLMPTASASTPTTLPTAPPATSAPGEPTETTPIALLHAPTA